MKTFSMGVALGSVVFFPALSQLQEDFSDGEVQSNPHWTGVSDHFNVNVAGQLQLAASVAGTSWLSTDFTIAPAQEVSWEFWIRQNFAPSGANYGRVYLMSDQAELSSALNGYYLQFGEAGSADALELFRQSGTARTSVCRGTDGRISSSFSIRVKVTKSSGGDWKIFTDASGGKDFVLEASGNDNAHQNSTHFGWLCTYTVSNAAGFFYDDIILDATTPPDLLQPEMDSVRVISLQALEIVFSEPVDKRSAEDVSHYKMSHYGQPTAATLKDERTVNLLFQQFFTNGDEALLSVSGVMDVAGNQITDVQMMVLLFVPQPISFRDLIINEVFADPEPRVGLPGYEFIEIFNRGTHPVQLNGWRFLDEVSTGIFADYLLLPESYVIVCSNAALPELSVFGPSVALDNFPALNNSRDKLYLASPEGLVIDSVHYTSAWYGDEDKSSGGWTLERVDPENSCHLRLNWLASSDISGGTPGRQNSNFKTFQDVSAPTFLKAEALSDTLVEIHFDEPVSIDPPLETSFLIVPDAGLFSFQYGSDARTSVLMKFASPLDSTAVYRLTASGVSDCHHNIMGDNQEAAILKLDVVPPKVTNISPVSANALRVTFSEKVLRPDAEQPSGYTLSYDGHPASTVLEHNQTSVTLHYAAPLANGVEQSLTIRGVSDLTGNFMPETRYPFLYFEPVPVGFRDVRITEIMADPSPIVALPESEYVEILNRSPNAIDLHDWTLSDGTTSAKLISAILQPAEYVILAAHAAAASLTPFGRTISLPSFPSLNNSADVLVLSDGEGKLIDSVSYFTAFYSDDEKADGGWSLELIDPDNICADGGNWVACDDPAGGSPGRQNSMFAQKPDHMGPKLLSVTPIASDTLHIVFSEKLEDQLPQADQLTFVPPVSAINRIQFTDAGLTTLKVIFSEGVTAGQPYILQVRDFYDCAGNPIREADAQVSFLLPEKAQPGDIVVNEVLFNPRPSGVDFVELFNSSEKIIDLKGFALRSESASQKTTEISAEHFLIYPHAYLTLTENPEVLAREYVSAKAETLWKMDLPALNDDAGALSLVSPTGVVIDSMQYHDGMHSPFVRDPEGISLERITPMAAGFDPLNWRSASADRGFATPGYQNSTLRKLANARPHPVSVEPEIIQLGSAGLDFAYIRYAFEESGLIANVKIVDPAGRTVRQLADAQLLGTEGHFRWEGEQENGSPASTGYYLIWFQVFDAGGLVKIFRNRIVVY